MASVGLAAVTKGAKAAPAVAAAAKSAAIAAGEATAATAAAAGSALASIFRNPPAPASPAPAPTPVPVPPAHLPAPVPAPLPEPLPGPVPAVPRPLPVAITRIRPPLPPKFPTARAQANFAAQVHARAPLYEGRLQSVTGILPGARRVLEGSRVQSFSAYARPAAPVAPAAPAAPAASAAPVAPPAPAAPAGLSFFSFSNAVAQARRNTAAQFQKLEKNSVGPSNNYKEILIEHERRYQRRYMLTEAELTVLRNAKTPEEIRHALNPVARALRDIFLKSSKVQAKKILNGKPVNRVNAAYAESTTTLRNRLEMVKANKNHVDHIMELWELLEVDLILGRAASILEYAARKLLFNSKSNLAQLEGNLNILKNQFLSFIHKYKIEGNDIQTAFDILIPEHLQGSLISYFRKCIPKLNTLKREIEEIIRKNPGYEHLAKDLERLNKYIRLLETLTGNGPFMYIGVGGGEIDEKLFDIANVSLIEELSTNEQIDESITYAEYTNYFNELLGIRKELIKNLDSELDKVKDILIKASNMENAEIKLNKENKRLTAASSTMENIDGGFRKNKTLNRKKMVRKTRKLGGGPLNRTAMIIGKELARKAAQGALKSEPFAQTAFKMAPMAFGTQLGNPALRKFSTNSRPFNNPKGAITKPKESSWTSENSKKNDHYWYDYMHNIEDNIKQSHESANFARQQMNKIFPPGRPKSINPNKKAKIATESQENLYGGTRRRRRHSKKHRTRKH